MTLTLRLLSQATCQGCVWQLTEGQTSARGFPPPSEVSAFLLQVAHCGHRPHRLRTEQRVRPTTSTERPSTRRNVPGACPRGRCNLLLKRHSLVHTTRHHTIDGIASRVHPANVTPQSIRFRALRIVDRDRYSSEPRGHHLSRPPTASTSSPTVETCVSLVIGLRRSNRLMGVLQSKRRCTTTSQGRRLLDHFPCPPSRSPRSKASFVPSPRRG